MLLKRSICWMILSILLCRLNNIKSLPFQWIFQSWYETKVAWIHINHLDIDKSYYAFFGKKYVMNVQLRYRDEALLKFRSISFHSVANSSKFEESTLFTIWTIEHSWSCFFGKFPHRKPMFCIIIIHTNIYIFPSAILSWTLKQHFEFLRIQSV